MHTASHVVKCEPAVVTACAKLAAAAAAAVGGAQHGESRDALPRIRPSFGQMKTATAEPLDEISKAFL